MMLRDDKPPVSPQLALRVALLGIVALALFAIVFFRLWYLQVLSGDQYLRQANDNRVRVERVQAPRGAIVDREGRPLVENEVATVVTLDPEKVPEADRDAIAEYGRQAGLREARPKGAKGPRVPLPRPTPALRAMEVRLSEVLGMRAGEVHERVVSSIVQTPYAKVRVKVAVPESVRDFLLERSRDFPGVDVERRYLRRYPEGVVAAQIFGTIGEITEDQLADDDRFKGVDQGTIVGQDGVEYEYDRYLRGTDGTRRIIVDALGRPKDTVEGREPIPGRQLRLSIDTRLQAAGQAALRTAMGRTGGDGGSFVAMDPDNGEVLAMGSEPSFDPAVLQRPMTQEQYEARFGEQAGSPLFNRAVLGLYATGSTYKPFTAIASLQSRVNTLQRVIQDSGCIEFGADRQEFCNAGKEPQGPVAMREAIARSSDVYFYTLGNDMNQLRGEPLQAWSRRFGFDRATGIDLPGDQDGTVPDTKWRKAINAEEAACRRKRGIPLGLDFSVYAAAARGCGLSDMREWSPGDNIQLAIGQGDLQATPLQLARAYAALANGGRLVQPHLATYVEDANGAELQRIDAGPSRRIDVDAASIQAVREGLRAATQGEGTSADVFEGWPHDRFPVYGKTGTAQRIGEDDHSWFAAWVEHPDKPIVVVVNVEEGGFGAAAAAPVARIMLSRWFGLKAEFIQGEARDR